MASLTQTARRTCAIVIVGFPIGGGVMAGNKSPIDEARLDRIVAQARRDAEQRDKGYRERALKMYPWICGRCAREFTRANLQELTVHHRNHDHDFNTPDGSKWEVDRKRVGMGKRGSGRGDIGGGGEVKKK